MREFVHALINGVRTNRIKVNREGATLTLNKTFSCVGIIKLTLLRASLLSKAHLLGEPANIDNNRNVITTHCYVKYRVIMVTVYKIAPRRSNQLPDRLKEASAWPGSARVVVPGVPTHVTQRGNRCEPVFFRSTTIALSPRVATAAPRRHGRMGRLPDARSCPPDHNDGGRVAGDLCRSPPGLHRAINARFRWTGHLFRGRFGAVVVDEPHLLAAARYIALNPVVAGLVSRAEN
jgi:hypothetical protein